VKPFVLALGLLAAACSVQLGDSPKWQLPAGYTATDVMLPMTDGTRLHAVRVVKDGAIANVLYFGGDSFRTETYGAYIANAVAQQDVNALLVDYRGYSRSEGTPTVALMGGDVLAVYDWLRAQTSLPIVVHGFPLGSFMAAHVAAQRNPQGLVLESSSTNVRDWVDVNAPVYVSVKIADTIKSQDNVARLKVYKGPLLIVAGDKDKVTPVSLSRKLLDSGSP
jgi:fermentation-respiration switch protein FrsA (DUF1100 family)